MHFDPENCKLKIGNEILERIGTDCTNKYLKEIESLKQNQIFKPQYL